MKTQITNEIIKWIGEDTYFPERESDDLDEGYNTALTDLRNKAPELAESIIAMVVGLLKKCEKYDADYDYGVGISEDGLFVKIEEAINNLTQE